MTTAARQDPLVQSCALGTAGSDRREGVRSECGWCPAADQAVACAVVCAQRDAAAQDCAGVREVRRCPASSGRCSDCATQSLLGPVRPLSSDTPTRDGQHPTQSGAIAQPAPLRPFRTCTATTACSPRAHRVLTACAGTRPSQRAHCTAQPCPRRPCQRLLRCASVACEHRCSGSALLRGPMRTNGVACFEPRAGRTSAVVLLPSWAARGGSASGTCRTCSASIQPPT